MKSANTASVMNEDTPKKQDAWWYSLEVMGLQV